jgi:steroid delta-isomerase-like uncharacterized protein
MTEMSVDQLKAIAERWIEEGWQKGRVSVVDELHSPDFVDHDPAGRRSDRQGFKEGIVQLYAGFPDLFAVIEDLIIDATSAKVAIRWSATGTHQGPFMSLAPTGKRVSFKGIEIIYVENEKIMQRWGEWDGIDILGQLGLWAA